MHGHRPAFLVAVLLCSGCTSFSSPLRSSSVPPLLRGSLVEIGQRLHAEIPVGTPVNEAMTTAASLGLEPSPQLPGELSGTDPDKLTYQHSGPNGMFGQATWIVTIECRDGKVAEIYCEKIATE